ncbi:hypothetical protein OJ253_497 [Cryptosporidium canis]|uniref:Uncharacterized protein n=1 Tax=Cryptosporidium canis TaxID=195482 RepID=A0A9D5HYU6_9CRYT|nr:hypothetical protein OJ253_497 [Cryptosporidium canis]
MSVVDICTRLRKPGLQLSELCTLINALGDAINTEILGAGDELDSIKLGWEQLIEVLEQTSHPTVRHVAFQNVKYILNFKNGVSERIEILYELSDGIVRLLDHWNVNIQLEIMDAILQDEPPDRVESPYMGPSSVLSSLVNCNSEVLAHLFSLMIQYNHCEFYFVVIKILQSFKLAVKGIDSEEAIKMIMDYVCQLGVNIELGGVPPELPESPDSPYSPELLESPESPESHESPESPEPSDPVDPPEEEDDYGPCAQITDLKTRNELLALTFEIFDNIPCRFQEAKIVSYNMIKDELNLLFSDKVLHEIDYCSYYPIIETGIRAMTRVTHNNTIVLLDHIRWVRRLWSMLDSAILNKDLNMYLEDDFVLLKIISQTILSVLAIYQNRKQILFIWDSELELSNGLELDIQDTVKESMPIISLDKITQTFIKFIGGLSIELFCSRDGVSDYVLSHSAIINIGLEISEGRVSDTPIHFNLRLLGELVQSLFKFAKEVRDYEKFQPFSRESSKLLESYFVLNYVLCKSYYVLISFGGDRMLGDTEKRLIQEFNSDFMYWMVFQTKIHMDELLSLFEGFHLRLIYSNLLLNWNWRYYNGQKVGRRPASDPERMLLAILRCVYKFAYLDGKIDSRTSVRPTEEEIPRLLSDFYFCCLYFQKLNSTKNADLLDQAESAILSSLPDLRVVNSYRYAKYFAVIGRYRLSRAIFESIKLFNMESCSWIRVLTHITHIYCSIQSLFRAEEEPIGTPKSSQVKEILHNLKYTFKEIESSFKLIRYSGAFFFPSIYIMCLSKIARFLTKCFYCRFKQSESSENINLMEVLIYLVDTLRSVFGIANVAKIISPNTFQVSISIYWSVKQATLRILLSNLELSLKQLPALDSRSGPDTRANPERELLAIENLSFVKQILLEALYKSPPKFNFLVEKSFIHHALPLFKLLNFEAISQVKLAIHPKKFRYRSLPSLSQAYSEKNPNDILISITHSIRKPGEKRSLTLSYLRKSPYSPKDSKTSSSTSIPSTPKFLSSNDSTTQNFQLHTQDSLEDACMHILATMGRIPPAVLMQRILPHVYLIGELDEFRDSNEVPNYSLEPPSSGNITLIKSRVAPVLKLHGFFRSGFQISQAENRLWVRIKITYLTIGGDEIPGSNCLDIYITETQFQWRQPIEGIKNSHQLKVVSVPLNMYKTCIGVPYTLYINTY